MVQSLVKIEPPKAFGGTSSEDMDSWIFSMESFLHAKRMEAPYGLALGQIQPCSRYVSSYLCTSAYSAGDKQYCLGLGGWASESSKVMSCVTWSKGGKTGSMNTSKNSSNKVEI